MFAHDLSDSHSGLNNAFFQLQSCNIYFFALLAYQPYEAILKMTERSDIHKSSIFNLQFPAQTGFTLPYNPASGISAALRPAKLGRVRVILWQQSK
jgi:hypothetical protein